MQIDVTKLDKKLYYECKITFVAHNRPYGNNQKESCEGLLVYSYSQRDSFEPFREYYWFILSNSSYIDGDKANALFSVSKFKYSWRYAGEGGVIIHTNWPIAYDVNFYIEEAPILLF
jgi:hypothetical protein